MRDTIFISHATPEDNEFTIWLASRLELLGYKVWIDKNELLGGEVFWDDIENSIKNRAIKVLLVYSENIGDKKNAGQIKLGIQKEIDLSAEVVRNNPELKDFLILLHLDKSPYNLFSGSQDLNQIPFSNNWADGLELLLKKFQKDTVPTFNLNNQNSFSEWYLEHYLIKNPIIEKKELYYTNWWSVEHLPKEFYIFRFTNEEQAKAVHAVNKDSLAIINANCITSFEKNLTFEVLHEKETIKLQPVEIHEIKISELLLGTERESFPTKRDAENYFKKLLKRAIHLLFRKKRLNWYELANKNLAYYHTTESLPNSKVSFSYPYRAATVKPKKKNLLGKYLTIGKWHFAVSVKPILKPYLGFNVKSHIVFTSDGLKTLEDKELIHRHRRKKGKRMFNVEWRDLLLAFISSFKNRENQISINVSSSNKLIMKNNVELFWSDYGYFDPKDLTRQSIFTYEDEEEIEETEQIMEV
jgi:hypothetical protein